MAPSSTNAPAATSKPYHCHHGKHHQISPWEFPPSNYSTHPRSTYLWINHWSHTTSHPITEVTQLLNSNAASVHTDLGGGTHGDLILTLSVALFATLCTTPFIIPNNCGPTPHLPARATVAQINTITCNHKENLCLWCKGANTSTSIQLSSNSSSKQSTNCIYACYSILTPVSQTPPPGIWLNISCNPMEISLQTS